METGLWIMNCFSDVHIRMIPQTFEDFAMALGGIAVITIAVRQHKDARLQQEARQYPEVARYTESGTFLWGQSIFWPDRKNDLHNIFRFRIFSGTFITNIQGYILHEGWFYPLLFLDPKVLEQAKEQQEKRMTQGDANPGVAISVPLTQTYARGDWQLVPIPNQSSKRKCLHAGPYYCIIFSLPSGRKYFLEEDEQYRMRLQVLEDHLPNWNRDYISWL
ncbi:MAG: hypothetical protein PHZ00_01075 [Candidatus Peribacteraceae bacterium]|nr:hypothetical protein [Candidatus Peribacteraceae bacterium]